MKVSAPLFQYQGLVTVPFIIAVYFVEMQVDESLKIESGISG